MKLSVCTANYGREDVFKVMDRVAELGADGVELTVMYHAVPSETDQAKRKQLLKHARANNLQISSLHFIFEGGTRLVDGTPEQVSKALNHLKSVVDLAADLEAPIVVFGGGGARSVPQGFSEQTALEKVRDVLARTASHAEHRGVVVVYESLNRYETNLGCTLAECGEIIRPIGSPALKVMGDTFHMNIDELSLADAIRAAKADLAHLHLADSHRLAPGQGHVDFPAVLKALKDIDFQGFTALELFWIKPGLPYLPTWELCDEQNRLAIDYLRQITV